MYHDANFITHFSSAFNLNDSFFIFKMVSFVLNFSQTPSFTKGRLEGMKRKFPNIGGWHG
jgi:hypothetical protein